MNPPATFSMTAPGATSASNAGSRRSIEPTPADPCAPPRDAIAPASASTNTLRFTFTLHLVVQHDRIVLLCRHRLLDERPDALVLGRRDPLLAQLFALELELEPVIVLGRDAAHHHRPTLEHLHADVAFVLD